MSRLGAIALKELTQLRRDRLTVAMMVVIPVVQLLVFGYAIDTDVRHVPTVVFDQDGGTAPRDVTRSLEATGFYDVVGNVRSYGEIEDALRRGTARVALVFPPGFSDATGSNRPRSFQLVVDGSDPQIVASATGGATGLVASRNAAAARIGQRLGGMQVEITNWYNPEQRTAVFVVPGIIGVILTMTMVMLTAMAIARERERGTLEALIVSPVRSVELMVGKIVPYVGIGYVQVTLILLVGHAVFEVPFQGSVALLYLMTLVFMAANLALGLVFSTLAKTQQQAMQMSFFFLLPNILLSGFAFPWEGMPRPAQVLSEVLPLTHFLRIVRGIVLKGANFDDLRPELGAMGLILLGFVALATLRFRKRLD